MSAERVAAGFVLFQDTADGRRYLVLTNAARNEPGLPKGHADPGESEIETARRETEEETGLTDLEVWGDFAHTLRYTATRKDQTYPKRVVYFLARVRSGEVRLSTEHSAKAWLPLDEARAAMPFDSLRDVLQGAGLFSKDPRLFDLHPAGRKAARKHLESLPQCTRHLVRHLWGGARLARTFAKTLHTAGVTIHVRATGTGTTLHDVGRAIGKHDDHPRQGLVHLRGTPLAPYGFACISHFTKGAAPGELLEAGVSAEQVADFQRLIDVYHLTWEEKCAALADACMKGDTPVNPKTRFADLRERYDAEALIALQERKTDQIRREIQDAIGLDPLAVVGLD